MRKPCLPMLADGAFSVKKVKKTQLFVEKGIETEGHT